MQLDIESTPSASAGTNTPEATTDEGSETAKAPAAETAAVTPATPTVPPAPSISEEELEKLVNKAVKAQMDPMLHQMMEIKMELSKPRLTEIMGGIGYIAGLTGLILWALGNKKRNG
jgi:nickel transport protein